MCRTLDDRFSRRHEGQLVTVAPCEAAEPFPSRGGPAKLDPGDATTAWMRCRDDSSPLWPWRQVLHQLDCDIDDRLSCLPDAAPDRLATFSALLDELAYDAEEFTLGHLGHDDRVGSPAIRHPRPGTWLPACAEAAEVNSMSLAT